MVPSSSSPGNPQPVSSIDHSAQPPSGIISTFTHRVSQAATALTDSCSTLWGTYLAKGREQLHLLRNRISLLPPQTPSTQHVQDAASEAFSHMSRLNEGEAYLDPNRLMTASSKHTSLNYSYFYWFLNQAILLEHLDNPDPLIQNRVSLAALHAYGKAATISSDFAQARGVQITPLSLTLRNQLQKIVIS